MGVAVGAAALPSLIPSPPGLYWKPDRLPCAGCGLPFPYMAWAQAKGGERRGGGELPLSGKVMLSALAGQAKPLWGASQSILLSELHWRGPDLKAARLHSSSDYSRAPRGGLRAVLSCPALPCPPGLAAGVLQAHAGPRRAFPLPSSESFE